MKNFYSVLGLSFIAVALSACQSTPRQYNGNVGYQIESKDKNSAVIAYTLAGRQNQQLDAKKLQGACQKVLQTKQNYKITVLSINEIANPAFDNNEQFGRQLGHSRTTIGLSNTPDLYNSENAATRQALDARPSTLRVVRYSCTL